MTSGAALHGVRAVVETMNGSFMGWTYIGNARREARTERAFGFWKVTTPLPEGLRRISGGRGALEFQCGACGEWAEWPAEADDFVLGEYSNVCGTPPRCTP